MTRNKTVSVYNREIYIPRKYVHSTGDSQNNSKRISWSVSCNLNVSWFRKEFVRGLDKHTSPNKSTMHRPVHGWTARGQYCSCDDGVLGSYMHMRRTIARMQFVIMCTKVYGTCGVRHCAYEGIRYIASDMCVQTVCVYIQESKCNLHCDHHDIICGTCHGPRRQISSVSGFMKEMRKQTKVRSYSEFLLWLLGLCTSRS